MPYIYVASPYTSHARREAKRRQEEERYREVMKYCTWLIKETNHHPFSPILHCHDWAKQYQLPGDAAFWERYNFAMLEGAQQIHVLNIPGAKNSKGIAGEIAHANMKNIGIWVAEESKPNFYSEDQKGATYELWQTSLRELAKILR